MLSYLQLHPPCLPDPPPGGLRLKRSLLYNIEASVVKDVSYIIGDFFYSKSLLEGALAIYGALQSCNGRLISLKFDFRLN